MSSGRDNATTKALGNLHWCRQSIVAIREDDNSLPCQKWSFVGAKKSLSIRSRGVRELRTD
jgi:hypothetical protein